MTGKSRSNGVFAVLVLVASVMLVLNILLLVTIWSDHPRPSAVKGAPTTKAVPFDAKTREEVRDFVAEEIDRQAGRSLQGFGTFASAAITVVSVLIAVALAVFGLTWWRQTQEHREAMEKATKHSEAIEKKLDEVNVHEQRVKDRLTSIEDMHTRMKNILGEAQEAAKEAAADADRAEANKRFAQALAYQNEGKLEAAIEEYDQLIEFAPDTSEAFNNRGSSWAGKKEYDKAIADYARAIELNPKCAEAFNNRGSAWAGKKEYDKAIADYDRAIEINPKYAEAFGNRGNAWSDKKEYDKAIADYDRAIEFNPTGAAAFSNRCGAWSYKKEYDKAIADGDRAIEFNPQYALAFSNRGGAWSGKKEYDKAIADYDRAIELDPSFASAYLNRAEAMIGRGDYERASHRASQAQQSGILKDPSDQVGAAYLTAMAMALDGGDFGEAEAEMDRLLAEGARPTKWNLGPLDGILGDLEGNRDLPEGALDNAKRIHEKFKSHHA